MGTTNNVTRASFHDKKIATAESTPICRVSRSQLATVYVAACSTAATSEVKRLSRSPDRRVVRCCTDNESSF